MTLGRYLSLQGINPINFVTVIALKDQVMNGKITPNQFMKKIALIKRHDQRSKDQAAPCWKRITG